MAIVSVGYDGSVDETQFEKIMGYSASSKFGVNSLGAFKASTVAGQVLQVRLSSAGGSATAWTAGVVDAMDADATVQLESPASGTRWDLIVLRRDYQPPGGSTSLAVVQGGSAKAIPTREVASGVLEDQPLWLVRVDAGSAVPAQYVDLRVFARNGGCTANDDMVREYMGSLGTMIEVNGILWLRRVSTSGIEEWAKLLDFTDSGWVFGARSGTGWTSGGGDYIYSRLKNGTVEVRVRLTRNGPDIPVSSTGDIGNVNIGQITSSHAPSFSVAALGSGAVGRNASIYVDGNGLLWLSAVSPGGSIRNGDLISATGSFFKD